MTENTHHIAVLTGDLVHSTDLGPQKIGQAFKALSNSAAFLEQAHGAPVNLSRHRGDGWQMALARPELALRSALGIRAALRRNGPEFDTYIGIATGRATGTISADLNQETSEVFIASGEGLSLAKALDVIRITHAQGGALSAATTLADHISQGWTPAQADAILPFLTPDTDPSYTDIAKKLGKSRQAVTKSAEAAGKTPLLAALTAIETAP